MKVHSLLHLSVFLVGALSALYKITMFVTGYPNDF